jgi:hypothetical protein
MKFLKKAAGFRLDRTSLQPLLLRDRAGMVVLLALVILGLGSCRDPADWYPSGTIELAGHYEFESAGIKALYATVLISNTGGSVISRSTFGLSARTNARSYQTTVVSETRILPGASIWAAAALPYASLAETLASGGISVGHEFFE